ncbi:hypothetical protein MY8738_007259 [Beauveria namnaoensis]
MPGNDTTHQHHNGGVIQQHQPPNWPGQKLVKLAASLRLFGMMRHYMAREGKQSGLEASSGRWDAAKSGDRRSHIATGEGAYDPAKGVIVSSNKPFSPLRQTNGERRRNENRRKGQPGLHGWPLIQQQTDR